MSYLGETYDEERDGPRINRQRDDVWRAIQDGHWHTLGELESITGHPQASISARLRDFRKTRFGSHVIEREYVERGLWRYRRLVNGTQGVLL